ncbi:GTP-binding protein [Vulgatibacter incomptus]|uniref:Gliding motility protein MglA n=1 Tax=Vulgatibacter incomptus TaxID=1391653 RepID=A0A0K1PHQ6_9BACT|nr:MglA protein [Vulgatibacter incomptus]AKU93042.1 gliding motility protein MglA [Vulgatibacter incomptus]
MQINQTLRELTLKVVYYGPALSGKTTNLLALHERFSPEVRGRLLTVDTKDDRTLFFDVLPVFVRTAGELRVKVKLYTVPGQVIHAATRRLVLQGADGVAFVADAQRSATPSNNAAWRNLMDDLRSNGIDSQRVPMVIQFNKMDLEGARTTAELEEARSRGKEPVLGAVAVRGDGVVETLRGLLQLIFRDLDRSFGLGSTIRLTEEEFLGEIFRNLDGAPARKSGMGGLS